MVNAHGSRMPGIYWSKGNSYHREDKMKWVLLSGHLWERCISYPILFQYLNTIRNFFDFKFVWVDSSSWKRWGVEGWYTMEEHWQTKGTCCIPMAFQKHERITLIDRLNEPGPVLPIFFCILLLFNNTRHQPILVFLPSSTGGVAVVATITNRLLIRVRTCDRRFPFRLWYPDKRENLLRKNTENRRLLAYGTFR